MTGPIIDRDAIIEKAARALVEHDADRMTCYDHMGACCPADGCAHGFTSRTRHQAAAVLASIADDLLAPIVAKHQPEEPAYPGERVQCRGCTEGCMYCEGNHFYDDCPTAQAVAAIREAVRA